LQGSSAKTKGNTIMHRCSVVGQCVEGVIIETDKRASKGREPKNPILQWHKRLAFFIAPLNQAQNRIQ
jgi:hypothetical protein